MTELADLIKTIGDSPLLLLYACPLALLIGMVHTFQPGHGKTIVCGYYVGRKREFGKIVFVTVVAVVTHLFSSALLGVIAMTSSQILVRNIILPKIRIGAALILILFGIGMLIAIFRKKKDSRHFHHHHHNHHHDDLGEHDHSHGRMDDMMNEMMKTERVPFHRYAQLFWLGLAGGLIPCIEPFTLMLFAIALDRILMGFALLISFGIGVFMTMLLLGLLVTSDRIFLDSSSDNRFLNLAGKAARIFKIAYPVILIILGSAWIYTSL